MLRYPAVDTIGSGVDKSTDIRAGAHSDFGKSSIPSLSIHWDLPISIGSLPLLFQRDSQPGLQVLTQDSTWSSVPVRPPGTNDDSFPPILVNIGDLMQFWTGRLLKSTVHRVIFPEGESQDRYSIAFFCHPLDHVEIEPVPSSMVQKRHDDTDTSAERWTSERYLQKRLAETYDLAKGRQ